jgi:hypothetical protein
MKNMMTTIQIACNYLSNMCFEYNKRIARLILSTLKYSLCKKSNRIKDLKTENQYYAF